MKKNVNRVYVRLGRNEWMLCSWLLSFVLFWFGCDTRRTVPCCFLFKNLRTKIVTFLQLHITQHLSTKRVRVSVCTVGIYLLFIHFIMMLVTSYKIMIVPLEYSCIEHCPIHVHSCTMDRRRHKINDEKHRCIHSLFSSFLSYFYETKLLSTTFSVCFSRLFPICICVVDVWLWCSHWEPYRIVIFAHRGTCKWPTCDTTMTMWVCVDHLRCTCLCVCQTSRHQVHAQDKRSVYRWNRNHIHFIALEMLIE